MNHRIVVVGEFVNFNINNNYVGVESQSNLVLGKWADLQWVTDPYEHKLQADK